jgi:outer membrane lipoprotein carrier protein
MPFPAFCGGGETIIQRVQEKFKAITTLTLNFDVHYQMAGSTQSSHEVGKLWLDHLDKFRLESPSRTIVCDGRVVWMYDPSQKQVILRNVEDQQGDILNPRQLFFDYPSRYQVKKVEKANLSGYSCDILSMIPKDAADPTRKLQVWIDRQDSYTRKILLEDLAGNFTTFEFGNFSAGQNLPDGTFQFKAPAGVEIIDTR